MESLGDGGFDSAGLSRDPALTAHCRAVAIERYRDHRIFLYSLLSPSQFILNKQIVIRATNPSGSSELGPMSGAITVLLGFHPSLLFSRGTEYSIPAGTNGNTP